MRYGQRGIAILGPLAHLIAYIVISQHPPYPVLVIVFILAGFGQGIADAAWNAWIGDMAHANELMGFLHGFYGLGATLSPLIATAMITRGGAKWYQWYYVMIGAALLELLFSVSAFWRATGEVFRAEHPPIAEEDTSTNKLKSRTATAMKSRITWLVSWFLLIYVGIEVALGGWVVTFMMRVRHGSAFASGLTSTGFWAGVTVGRVVLGFVTPRVFKGERWAITTYLLCSAVLELLFWLIPQFYVSAVAVALLGFFLAPLFPAAVTAAMKILPKHLHVAAIGFAAAFGSAGACILPFAVGAIAQKRGVEVLQPIVLAMLVVALAIWMAIGVDLGKQERKDRDVKEGALSRRLHLRRVWGFRNMNGE
jgi:fucose permease